jgi:hypothetical protein
MGDTFSNAVDPVKEPRHAWIRCNRVNNMRIRLFSPGERDTIRIDGAGAAVTSACNEQEESA